MVKVTNPLGGTEAHGTIGKSIIFQGTTAKAYKAPVINKTSSQLSAQDRFESVNKMLHVMGAWGRGMLETIFGRSWMSSTYQAIAIPWAARVAEYDLFNAGHKAAWLESAPNLTISLDRGLVFYACSKGIHDHIFFGGLFNYLLPVVNSSAASAVGAWWNWDFDDVLLDGKYDELNSAMDISLDDVSWEAISDGSAYMGGFAQSIGNDPMAFNFWFYGKRFGLIYKELLTAAAMSIQISEGDSWVVSQNNAREYDQIEWVSPIVALGLHKVTVWKTGPQGTISIDGIKIYG